MKVWRLQFQVIAPAPPRSLRKFKANLQLALSPTHSQVLDPVLLAGFNKIKTHKFFCKMENIAYLA